MYEHCLHELAPLALVKPVTYVHVCCYCGDTRRTVGRLVRPEGHGPKLPYNYTETVYDSPWLDECEGRKESEDDSHVDSGASKKAGSGREL